jgi:hypothetical protein
VCVGERYGVVYMRFEGEEKKRKMDICLELGWRIESKGGKTVQGSMMVWWEW